MFRLFRFPVFLAAPLGPIKTLLLAVRPRVTNLSFSRPRFRRSFHNWSGKLKWEPRNVYIRAPEQIPPPFPPCPLTICPTPKRRWPFFLPSKKAGTPICWLPCYNTSFKVTFSNFLFEEPTHLRALAVERVLKHCLADITHNLGYLLVGFPVEKPQGRHNLGIFASLIQERRAKRTELNSVQSE